MNALIKQVRLLPQTLRKSLTWDRGLEMAQHKDFSVATNVDLYISARIVAPVVAAAHGARCVVEDVVLAVNGVWLNLPAVLKTLLEMSIRLVPTPIPIELSVGGSAGESSYKEAPIPSKDRLIYGATAECVFRFRSGASLLEMARGYD